MDALPPNRFADIATLFLEESPNAAMLFATLDRRVPGRVIVDHPEQPTCALVQADYYGFTFASHAVQQGFLEAAVTSLLADGPVMLVWPARDQPIVPPPADRLLDRVALYGFDISASPLNEIRVPPGCMLTPMDSGLVPRCQWHEQVVRAMGSVDRFLTYGLGVCLVKEDEILSEAYMCFWGAGKAEIGVVTQPEHRGKGYGLLTARHLIELCEERGLDTYTTCYTQNASLRQLSHKVGLTEEQPYELRVYGAAQHDHFETIAQQNPITA
ncbi:GNAT family N-acetyltransferase [Mucisphaera sp.]|uniref:GNAT family N-acetyltransferase n=1 Tax=Mucisphaera sp. TaxID=2913024 RepID=UPI003D10F8BC